MPNAHFLLRCCILLLLATALRANAQAPPLYTATFLPDNFIAAGIGGGGQVVGRGVDADGNARAFVWDAGTTTLLPTLGGPAAYATASAGGAVVGASAEGAFTRAFVYRDGAIADIGTPSGADSIAYGINAAGQVVGEATDADGNSRAFLYGGGVLADIGTLGGTDARARGINAAGAVVGGSQPGSDFPDDGAHAFLYRDGAMTDLGTLGGGFSWANAINDAGQVAGYSLVAGDAAWQPFLYSDGVMTGLGSFGGDFAAAYAINGAGAVVGTSALAEGGFAHAFLYADGVLSDLNGLVDGGLGIFTLTEAVGIDDAGRIVANGCTVFGFCAPVLLSPVPEPAPPAMLLAGMFVLLLARLPRRRRCPYAPCLQAPWPEEGRRGT